MSGLRRKISCILIITIIVTNSIVINAETLSSYNSDEQQYCEIILKQLKDKREVFEENIISAKVIKAEKTSVSTATTNRCLKEEMEAVAIHMKNDDTEEILYAIPFEHKNGKLTNVTRASVQNKPFEDSQYVYVLVTAVYHYYNLSETDGNGPYYKPSLVKAKWSDSSGKKSVKSMYAIFKNRSHVVNLSNYVVDGDDYLYNASSVSQDNPGNGITYVGNVLNMGDNKAYTMFFNGLDAYSFVYGYIIDNSSQKYEFSFSTFDGSGLYQ